MKKRVLSLSSDRYLKRFEQAALDGRFFYERLSVLDEAVVMLHSILKPHELVTVCRT